MPLLEIEDFAEFQTIFLRMNHQIMIKVEIGLYVGYNSFESDDACTICTFLFCVV
jgi:hypothetical protein